VTAPPGELAKQAGMALAAANTDPDWAAQCDEVIRIAAATGLTFQAADLVLAGVISEPDHPNRWGPRFLAAHRAGVITKVGFAQSKRPTVHRSICRTWKGTQPT
jgi:hypothetical protein